MRTSIKEVKSKYFINEQEGVIVCVISGYTYLLGECENFEVKGISRCHKDDKYNETHGCRLAESRAKLKMFKLAEKRANRIYKELSNLASEMSAIKSANIACQKVETEHLSTLNARGGN